MSRPSNLVQYHRTARHMLRKQGWIWHARYWIDSYGTVMDRDGEDLLNPEGWCLRLLGHPDSEVQVSVLLYGRVRPLPELSKLLDMNPGILIYDSLVVRPEPGSMVKMLNRAALLFREISVMNRNTKLKES